MQKSLVIGTPAFNEAGGIAHFLAAVDKLAGVVKAAHPGLEVSLLIVNDGSKDETAKKIMEYRGTNLRGVELYNLSRNFGPYAAISAIFDKFVGDGLIIMDADLQDSVDAVPELVTLWMNGYENIRVVRGRRAEGLLHQILSRIFYQIFGRVSGLRSGLGTFGLYDKKVLAAFKTFPEKIRYIPGMITLTGFKTIYVEVDRKERFEGKSRVGFVKLISFAMLAIFSFSSLPIHLITALGAIISAFSFLAAVGIVIFRLVNPTYNVLGWSSLICVQFFFGGITLLAIGVLGQYIAIIFHEAKGRPIYVLDEKQEKRF